MSRRISVNKAKEIVYLSSEGLQNKEISKKVFVSESTVSRVLRQKETYLSGDNENWYDDKIIGKRCYDCGIIFTNSSDRIVVCRSCSDRRKYLGLPPIPVSKYNEI